MILNRIELPKDLTLRSALGKTKPLNGARHSSGAQDSSMAKEERHWSGALQ